MPTSAGTASIITSAATTSRQPQFGQSHQKKMTEPQTGSSVGNCSGFGNVKHKNACESFDSSTTSSTIPFTKDIDFISNPSSLFNFSRTATASTNTHSHFQNSSKGNNTNFNTGMNTVSSMAGIGNCGQGSLPNGRRIAEELEDFVERGLEGALAAERGEEGAPSEEAIAELQLQTARKLRQLLPTSRDSLHLVQERNWIPLLLGWLNLHDRPAVQVEALWALTNLAGLSSSSWSSAPPSSSFFPTTSTASTPVNSNPYFPSSGDASSSGVNPPYMAGGIRGSDFTSMSPVVFPQSSHSHQGMTTSSSSGLPILPPSSMSGNSTSCKKSYSGISSSAAAAALSSAVALASSSSPLLPPPSSSSLLPSSNSTMLLPPPSSSSSATLASVASSSAASLSAAAASTIPKSSASSSPSTHLLLRHPDAIPTLVSLLNSPNREVHEQAMWILGSVAAGEGSGSTSSGFSGSSGSGSNSSSSGGGNSSSSSSSVAAAREAMLAAGVMGPLIRCLESNPHNLSLQRIGSWALSNLVDGQFQQNNNGNSKSNNNGNHGNNSVSSEIDARMILPTLRRLLHMADAEVLSHTCWTLSHLCDGPSSHIAAVVSPAGGLVPRLVDLLLHPSWRVTKPALRTIGNVVCAECVDDSASSSPVVSSCFADDIDGNGVPSVPIPADYTEIILECGAVPRLKELITHGNREIQKEACWTLSNIAAGTVDQIQAVIDSGAIAPLVKLASDPNTDQEVRSEACWVVLNATSCGSDSQIEILVAEGCVSVLGMLLGEASMVMMALEGLERVLQVEEAKEMARKARMAVDVEARFSGNNEDDSDSIGRGSLVSASLIEALEQHKNSAVSKRAGKIWKQHFVSCALCRQSFSRHRSSEARFCNECKCHVCSNCDCEVYHLSYQEELWAANEEKTQQSRKAKKSKKQKKKEKRKRAKKQTAASSNQDGSNKSDSQSTNNADPSSNGRPSRSASNAEEESLARSRSSTTTSSSDSASAVRTNRPPVNELAVVSAKPQSSTSPEASGSTTDLTSKKSAKIGTGTKKSNRKKKTGSSNSSSGSGKKVVSRKASSPTATDDEEDDIDEDNAREYAEKNDNDKNSDDKAKDSGDIDFVLYLQQTGSIIALAKLMDALEYGELDASDHYLSPNGSGFDDRDVEPQMFSEQRFLSRQTEA